ncbi:MAG: aminotransferase class III-fold pyridoxal phosphate-dependent enzyme, partial [Maribacter sp.]
ENAYTSVSEEFAWSMLHKWIKLNPKKVLQKFRTAIGFPNTIKSSIKTALTQRHKHLSPILSLSYKEPIQMVGSAFQYMYDAHGNTFLDAYNNIPHVGHCHPKVVEAGRQQMGKLNTNTRYLYDLLPQYAKKLLAKFPKSLNKVFFVNSGSAASDLAIRMAKIHTNKHHIMVMEHGYHGNTQTAIDISDYKFNNKKGQGQKDDILKTALPDAYRGKYGNNGELYGQDAINKLGEELETVAAFIAEPIVGCGGQVPLAEGYLKYLYPKIRKHGGLCISDEVQTGFGRLGDYYWGFEMYDVVPDIVILGKPMGNGHPIGAVVVTDEIARSFEKGVEFFSSFGGNPVSCAIGLSVLNIIDEEDLQENAKEVGDYYQNELRKLQQNHKVIGDVRGSGLFIGIDIVHAGTKQTNYELAQYLKNELRQEHILISTDGPDDSVLKTKPPLCFTKNNVDSVIKAIDSILSNLSS